MKKIRYRSKAEARFAKYLKSKDIKFEYEPYKIYYVISEKRSYTPDFIPKTKWSSIVLEFKGRFTAADRKKMLLVREQNMGYDYRLVFQQDNKISKQSKTRYSDWAKKNGFKYHVGISLPKEWIEELK